jgi:hypothetical protein
MYSDIPFGNRTIQEMRASRPHYMERVISMARIGLPSNRRSKSRHSIKDFTPWVLCGAHTRAQKEKYSYMKIGTNPNSELQKKRIQSSLTDG